MFSFFKIIFHAEVIGMFHYSYVHSNTQAVGPCSMQISSLDLHMSQPESRLVSSPKGEEADSWCIIKWIDGDQIREKERRRKETNQGCGEVT